MFPAAGEEVSLADQLAHMVSENICDSETERDSPSESENIANRTLPHHSVSSVQGKQYPSALLIGILLVIAEIEVNHGPTNLPQGMNFCMS